MAIQRDNNWKRYSGSFGTFMYDATKVDLELDEDLIDQMCVEENGASDDTGRYSESIWLKARENPSKYDDLIKAWDFGDQEPPKGYIDPEKVDNRIEITDIHSYHVDAEEGSHRFVEVWMKLPYLYEGEKPVTAWAEMDTEDPGVAAVEFYVPNGEDGKAPETLDEYSSGNGFKNTADLRCSPDAEDDPMYIDKQTGKSIHEKDLSAMVRSSAAIVASKQYVMNEEEYLDWRKANEVRMGKVYCGYDEYINYLEDIRLHPEKDVMFRDRIDKYYQEEVQRLEPFGITINDPEAEQPSDDKDFGE